MNNRKGESFTKEKLDKALANPQAMGMFLDSSSVALPAINSDHSPFIINISKDFLPRKKKKYMFRYEVAWKLRVESVEVIKKPWLNELPGNDMQRILLLCKRELTKWRNQIHYEERSRTSGLLSHLD